MLITGQADPDFWRRRVAQRKVDLGSLVDHSVEEVTAMAIKKELSAMARESLLKRADLLHEICGVPKVDFGSYKYERQELIRIDRLRQEIVHGDRLSTELGGNIESDLRYVRHTCDYFFVMMHESFGLRIDPQAFGKTTATKP